jgi:hypothetical protein
MRWRRSGPPTSGLQRGNRGLTDRAHPHRDPLVVALRAYRKAVADLNPATAFRRMGPLNYPAFTNDSLSMMYEGIRGALAADDALGGLDEEPRFRVRETPDWKLHAAELETEMLGRGMMFEVIDWSEDQAGLPFAE